MGGEVVGNPLEGESNRLTMRRFICIECTEIVLSSATYGNEIALYWCRGDGSVALLVSQYAVWAEQWAYQPPWELTSLCPSLDFNCPCFCINSTQTT